MPGNATVVLVHSPALSPETWRYVAGRLGATHRIVVPDLMPALQTAPPYWRAHTRLVRDSLADHRSDASLFLVGHSGAGPLLPLIAQELERTVAGCVFIDAGLPRAGPWLAGAPAHLADQLMTMAVDGVLPKWTDWWEPADIAAELPDPRQRAALANTLEPLPLAMLTEDRPDPGDWRSRPSTYLQLSAGYGTDAATARKLGWPVLATDSTHLGIITEPDWVAAAVGSLLAQLSQEDAP